MRASTEEQDATRAKESLTQFANNSNLTISAFFIENESGAKLDRPELLRLLDIAQAHDVILVEQIDRLSRLDNSDWNKLMAIIKSKQLRIVSLNLPTSRELVKGKDEFTNHMLTALNQLMLEILAAMARKDYQDRRRRQAEGIDEARGKRIYKGRGENTELHQNIRLFLSEGKSYNRIVKLLKCSRGSVAKVTKRMKDETDKKLDLLS